MVTHNVALVTPLAASVVSMGSDGRVLAAGSPAETVFRDQALAEQFAHEQAALALEEELEEEILADDPKTRKQGEKLVLAEEVQRGSVGWNALKLYFTSLSRTPILYVAGCFMFAAWVLSSSSSQTTLKVHAGPAKVLLLDNTGGWEPGHMHMKNRAMLTQRGQSWSLLLVRNR
jgi:hypothetical protein